MEIARLVVSGLLLNGVLHRLKRYRQLPVIGRLGRRHRQLQRVERVPGVTVRHLDQQGAGIVFKCRLTPARPGLRICEGAIDQRRDVVIGK